MNTASDVYKKTFGKSFDMETFAAEFEKAVDNFPITRDMPHQNKRMQAAQRIKWLGENRHLSGDFSVEVLQFIFDVSEEELDMISF